MKIKHWQGYGCVTANKISKTVKNGICTLRIHVEGNHECGLVRDDLYDLSRWLIKRFDKSFTDCRSIISMSYDDGYKRSNGLDVEYCDYTFKYEL